MENEKERCGNGSTPFLGSACFPQFKPSRVTCPVQYPLQSPGPVREPRDAKTAVNLAGIWSVFATGVRYGHTPSHRGNWCCGVVVLLWISTGRRCRRRWRGLDVLTTRCDASSCDRHRCRSCVLGMSFGRPKTSNDTE